MGPLNISQKCTCNPGLCSTGFIAHTQYFFNDLQRVGKEHVLMPVGGASVPSTCRREGAGSELRHLLHAAKARGFSSLFSPCVQSEIMKGSVDPRPTSSRRYRGTEEKTRVILFFVFFFSTDAANHISISVLVHHVPQVKDTRRCFLVPGKQGSPKV